MSHSYDEVEVIKRNSNTVYRLAFSQTRNKNDAYDIYQDVFLRYLKRKPVFENDEHEKAWFIRVTLNCSKTHLKSFRNPKLEELDESFEAEEVGSRSVGAAAFSISNSEKRKNTFVRKCLSFLRGKIYVKTLFISAEKSAGRPVLQTRRHNPVRILPALNCRCGYRVFQHCAFKHKERNLLADSFVINIKDFCRNVLVEEID